MENTEKISLTNQQAIELATFGFTLIYGQMMFKIKRFDNVLQAEAECQAIEIIAKTNTAAFILSPSSKTSERVHPALNHLGKRSIAL